MDLIKRIRRQGADIYRARRSRRTEIIATVLHQMARKRHYKFHPYEPRNRKEYLCDFTWLRLRKSHPLQLKGLVLAAECEWAIGKKGRGSHILYDFRKLLPLKASIKLCVYHIPPGAKEAVDERVRKKISRTLREYEDHLAGERYFLLEIRRRRGNERATVLHLAVPRNGSMGRVQLRELAWATP